MTTRYALQTTAELKNLSQIRDFVEMAAKRLGFEPDLIPNVQLAVDEATTNVMLHGYQGQGGSLEVELERIGGDLVVRLRDEAPPFDPTTVPAPDFTLPLAKRPVGGLGIYLVRRAMDEVIHRVTAAGGNELTLVKHDAADG
ncbi:MAG: ATP-binding protein [Anaerolineales bacterium]|nr:ATP-binding protein [Anaerolineales bacterium]